MAANKQILHRVFMQAIRENDPALCKSLLDSVNLSRTLRESLQSKNELGGFTPLQYVCFQGNSTMASILINSGSVNVNEKGEFDWTALHTAVFSSDITTVQLLLNSCADCFTRDENNKLPIDYAQNENIYKLLHKSMLSKRNGFCSSRISQDPHQISNFDTDRGRRAAKYSYAASEESLDYSDEDIDIWCDLTPNSRKLSNLKRWSTITDLNLYN